MATLEQQRDVAVAAALAGVKLATTVAENVLPGSASDDLMRAMAAVAIGVEGMLLVLPADMRFDQLEASLDALAAAEESRE